MKFHGKIVHILGIFCEAVFIYSFLNSGLHSSFAVWPASSVGSVLSCKVNGHSSRITWATFLLHFTNSFFVGRLESVGLGFSIRISVMVSGYFSRQKGLACLPWIFMKNSRNAFAYFPWIFTTYNTSRWQVCELSRLCMWAVHSMTCPVRELAIVHKLAVCKLVLAVCALFINNAVVDSVNVWL